MKSVILCLLPVLFIPIAWAEEPGPIDDPIKDFVNSETFYTNSEVYVIRSDLNQDGIKDYLLSANTDIRYGARAGTKWDVYASTSEGFRRVENLGPSLYLRTDAASIRPLEEYSGRNGIVAYFPSNADSGSFSIYVVTDDFKLKTVSTSYVMVSDGKGSVNESVLKKYYGNGVVPKKIVIPSETIKTKYGIQLAEPIERMNDVFHVTDKENPSRSLVYSRKTKELLGYEQFGKFYPVKDGEIDSEKNSAEESVRDKDPEPPNLPPKDQPTASKAAEPTPPPAPNNRWIWLLSGIAALLILAGLIIWRRAKSKGNK